MKNTIKQPKWKKVEFSRSQIIKAGKIIKHAAPDENIDEAIKIVDNWRESHAYPMHVVYVHLKRLAKKDSSIIVAERLKRLESIISKIKREQNMSLYTMQDLGGCRFIVPTINDVYKYSGLYENSSKRHILRSTDDYIINPKPSGYRGLHVVYEFKSDKNDTYNKNMLIEIQYRTHLQHLWATAVETMGLFNNKAIKSGEGNIAENRFFALISTLFAIKEKQPLVPDTPSNIKEIARELSVLDKENKFLSKLSGIKVAVDYSKNLKWYSNGYCLLILNYEMRRLKVIQFKSSEIEMANAMYNKIEKSVGNKAKIDAVLVRVSSINILKSAYPNYFSDIQEFVGNVEKCIKIWS